MSFTQEEQKTIDRIENYIINPPKHGGSMPFTITPAVAKYLWDKHGKKFANRPERRTKTTRYAKNMREGFWVMTGDVIRFSTKGRMIDGRHRILACILADKPFVTQLFFGVDEVAYSYIDLNAPKTAADVLAQHGVQYSTEIAGAIRFLEMIRTGTIANNISISPPEMEAIWGTGRYRDLGHWVSDARSANNKYGHPISMLMSVYFLGHQIDADLATRLAAQLAHKQSFTSEIEVPHLRLTGHLAKMKNDSVLVRQAVRLAYLVELWNAIRAGRSPRYTWTLSKPGTKVLNTFPALA